MSQKLAEVEKKISELEAVMADPAAGGRPGFGSVVREHGILLKTADMYRNIDRVGAEIAETEAILADKDGDEELRAMAEEELPGLRKREQELQDQLLSLIADQVEPPHEDAIMEIRAGTGGDEAGLFARDLFEMYERYAATRKWKVEMMDSNPTEIGGFKQVVCNVKGTGAYRALRFESGTHRVQRVPKTEASGRIHTSAVTVAVLPEVQEVDVEIDPNDLRIDTFRSSGPGGQSVNKTSSAVRITHEPSGIVVSCQDEKSQHKNKSKAMRILRSRLYQHMEEEKRSARDQARRSQIGTGDRSQKIRTYNFPQSRLTDHRINLTIYSLDKVMLGELGPVVDALAAKHREELLETLK